MSEAHSALAYFCIFPGSRFCVLCRAKFVDTLPRNASVARTEEYSMRNAQCAP